MTEREIQRELSLLDHNLFLDKRKDDYGRVYYCVCFNHGQGEPFETVKWVYPDGTPKPYLNMDLINQVRSQEGSLTEAIEHAKKNNLDKRQKAREDAYKLAEEIAHEWQVEGRHLRTINTSR